MRRFGLTILLLVTALSLASCDRNHALVNVEDAPFKATGPASLDQMAEVIDDAGFRRGWTMTLLEPGKIKGEILVRNRHQVVVDILYDTESFSIIYVDSKNMNYRLRDGEPRIHPSYMRWIKNLRQDIQERSERP